MIGGGSVGGMLEGGKASPYSKLMDLLPNIYEKYDQGEPLFLFFLKRYMREFFFFVRIFFYDFCEIF